MIQAHSDRSTFPKCSKFSTQVFSKYRHFQRQRASQSAAGLSASRSPLNVSSGRIVWVRQHLFPTPERHTHTTLSHGNSVHTYTVEIKALAWNFKVQGFPRSLTSNSNTGQVGRFSTRRFLESVVSSNLPQLFQ